jgi:hypothetical protein
MELVPLTELNSSELREITKNTTGLRSIDTDENIINFLETNKQPTMSPFAETRRTLELYLFTNWGNYSTNMPCNGQPLAGKCTKFSCSDFMHSSCYAGLKEKIV